MRLRWRLPVCLAATAVLYVGLVDWVLVPLNERGSAQTLTAWLDGAGRLVQLPGMLVTERLGLRLRDHASPAAWAVMMAANLPFYWAAATILRKAIGGRRKPPPANAAAAGQDDAAVSPRPTIPTRTAPRRAPAAPSRRDFMAAGGRVALGGAAAVLGYSFLDEPHRFVVTRRTVPIPDLPPSLDGMTVAQLTDIHHGPWTSLAYVRRVVAAANGLGADLIALTGDYVLFSPAYIAPVVAELAKLRAKIGVVAVMGNHDWWEDGYKTIAEFRKANIPLIDNDRTFLTPRREWTRDGGLTEGLCVAGIGDLWEGSPHYGAALGGVSRRLPRLLLSHNPDAAEMSAARRGQYRVDLMLSGHTHGGQIWVPGLGTPLTASAFGQKYARGLVRGPAFPVFISSGLGTTIMPLRFRRPPEIALIQLRAAG